MLDFITSDSFMNCTLSNEISINHVDKAWEGRGAKCLLYYISLCNKTVYKGEGGVKKVPKSVYVVYERPLNIKIRV